MTWLTISLGKRAVTDWKKKSLVRTTMGVMTGKTGIDTGPDPLVNRQKSAFS